MTIEENFLKENKNLQAQELSMPWKVFGLSMVWIYVCTSLNTDHIGKYAGSLLILSTAVYFLKKGKCFLRSKIFYLFLLAIAIQLAVWAINLAFYPDVAEGSPKVDRLGAWFYLIPLAIFMGSSQRVVIAVWCAGIVALLLSPWLTGGGWAEIQQGFAGRRVDFGINNAQHIAMLFGVAVIGLMVFFNRFLHFTRQRNLMWLWPIYAVGLLSCLSVVIMAQTRAVWIGLGLCMLFLFLAAIYISIKRGFSLIGGSKKLKIAGIVAMALLIAAPLINYGNILEKRIQADSRVLISIVNGNSIGYNQGSVGVRLYTWIEAVNWIKERPFLGWGGKGRSLVVDSTEELSAETRKHFRHLHNSYLDTAVNFGLAGLFVMFGLFGVLTHSAIKSWQRHQLSGDMLVFWITFTTFWFVVNFFESYMYYSTGTLILGIVAGGMLSQIWRIKRQGTGVAVE